MHLLSREIEPAFVDLLGSVSLGVASMQVLEQTFGLYNSLYVHVYKYLLYIHVHVYWR